MPSSPYAATKYAGELLVTSYNQVYNLPTLNLRFFMVGTSREPVSHLDCLIDAASVEPQPWEAAAHLRVYSSKCCTGLLPAYAAQ